MRFPSFAMKTPNQLHCKVLTQILHLPYYTKNRGSFLVPLFLALCVGGVARRFDKKTKISVEFHFRLDRVGEFEYNEPRRLRTTGAGEHSSAGRAHALHA